MFKDNFANCFCMFQKYLLYLAYARLQNRMDAEDAVQETFVRAWVYCERLENDDAFVTWLFRILTNECHNILRKRKHRHELYSEINLDFLSDDIQEDRTLARIDFVRAMHNLENRYRIPIQMIYLSGLGTKEVAAELNKTCSAVSGMVRRGKEKLRAVM